MIRKIAIFALGATMLLTASLTGAIPALAMPRGNGLPVVKAQSVQLVNHRRMRRNRIYYKSRRDFRHREFRRRDFRHRRHNNGAAAVAAIIGLGTILAITSSNRRHAHYDDRYNGYAPVYGYQSGSPEWIAACARKYRSFEPYSGLYTTYGGVKRRCRLP